MIFFAPVVRSSKIPLAMWVHGLKMGRHWLNWLLGRVQPDLAICSSQFTQQAFLSLFPSVESAVIYAPLTLDADGRSDTQRAAVRQELRTPEDAIVIVLASRMVLLKGHRRLIKALAALKAETSWHCWIVGGIQARCEIAYFNELQSLARDAGLTDRIHFTGQRSDVPGILAAADLCCQPNLRGEFFSIVFIEAMLAGLPVVTSAMGGALEAIDQDSGILVPPNDPQALSKVLGTILTDPALRRRLGRGGPARARQLCDPAARLYDLHAALQKLMSSSLATGPTNLSNTE
jgi:glycosyltransferase involved in cell wall biosynthesis